MNISQISRTGLETDIFKQTVGIRLMKQANNIEASQVSELVQTMQESTQAIQGAVDSARGNRLDIYA